MSADNIRSILERLAAVEEGRLTPVAVKKGLNQQQKSVDQLPALFKPKNISPTLSKKPYQKHPMDGKLVGDSVEPKKNALEEAMQEVEEDMLGKVKRDFIDYIGRLEDKINDDGRREKSTPELDKLSKKEKIDRDLIDKARDAVEKGEAEEDINEDPTQSEPSADFKPAPIEDPVLPESDPMDSEVGHDIEDNIEAKLVAPEQPVRTYPMEDGSVLECWGNDEQGYEIRRNGQAMPTRFPNRDHADMAVKIFQKHRAKQDRGQDYIEEK